MNNNGFGVLSRYAAINTGHLVSCLEAVGRTHKARVKDAAKADLQRHTLLFRRSGTMLRGVLKERQLSTPAGIRRRLVTV